MSSERTPTAATTSVMRCTIILREMPLPAKRGQGGKLLSIPEASNCTHGIRPDPFDPPNTRQLLYFPQPSPPAFIRHVALRLLNHPEAAGASSSPNLHDFRVVRNVSAPAAFTESVPGPFLLLQTAD